MLWEILYSHSELLKISRFYPRKISRLKLFNVCPIGANWLVYCYCFYYRTFSMIGLILIAIGTGGIKPCVSAFGGDQFVLPQQDKQFASFFSIFYFSINAGSLISTTITPIFRKDISCSSDNTCYPLAFGVPAILMVISLSKSRDSKFE